MSRKKGFIATLAQMQYEADKHRLQQLKAQSQAFKAAQQAQMTYQRAQAQAQEMQRRSLAAEQKERERLYYESQAARANWQNAELEQKLAQFQTLLQDTLAVDDYYDLNQLKEQPNLPQFQPGQLGMPLTPPQWQMYQPPEPTAMQKLVPGTKQKYEQEMAFAHQRFQADLASYNLAEAQRKTQLNSMYAQYQRYVADLTQKAQAKNAEIDQFQAELVAGMPQAMIDYCTLVLQASVYPEEFNKQAKLAYLPEARHLVVEYELPGFDIIPTGESYKYIKARDSIVETPRKETERRTLYSSVVSQVTLRTIHELFEADRLNHLDVITFNGVVETLDRSTGNHIRVCLVSLRTTRESFLALNLAMVEPVQCLKGLKASFSSSPAELVPVRPVVEFNMVDARFIQETDVIAGLDQRPNLLELTPGEFEALVTNLFQKMGLEAKLTRASRDGGVDCVAFDPRPVLGGKVVIQAKRYKNVVDVSAVRDLYGTLHNEGASKGILVTTSHFGKAAYDFVQGKPLELLDGANLLYLLKEYAGIEARIVMV
jgi:restriction system protein